jgi:hypothetical protein
LTYISCHHKFNLELNFTMLIVFTLFLALAAANALELAAESYDEHRLLRGPNDTGNDEDRDLLTIGSTSQSFSFSAVSAYGAGDFCFDYQSSCIEDGYAVTAAKTYADANGNSIAFADSVEYLFLQAFCASFAESFALTCAFTKVDGDIQVTANADSRNFNQEITLGLQLNAATTTFATASSVAEAATYTAIDSQAFTSAGVASFCNQYPWFPTCSGFAGTSLSQIATADASSFGVASASSSSGALATSGAFVKTAGSKYSYINGLLTAVVKAWSFAEASAAAGAFAESFTLNINNSFANVCVEQFASICASSSYGWCGSTPEEACAAAWASGSSWAFALAEACAQTFVDAFAEASSSIHLMANVDCSKVKPALAWSTTACGFANACE